MQIRSTWTLWMNSLIVSAASVVGIAISSSEAMVRMHVARILPVGWHLGLGVVGCLWFHKLHLMLALLDHILVGLGNTSCSRSGRRGSYSSDVEVCVTTTNATCWSSFLMVMRDQCSRVLRVLVRSCLVYVASSTSLGRWRRWRTWVRLVDLIVSVIPLISLTCECSRTTLWAHHFLLLLLWLLLPVVVHTHRVRSCSCTAHSNRDNSSSSTCSWTS